MNSKPGKIFGKIGEGGRILGAGIVETILGVMASPGVDTHLDASVKASKTLRARLAMRRTNPSSASCRNMMDPIGLSMENFEQTGKWRLPDSDFPVDASRKRKAA